MAKIKPILYELKNSFPRHTISRLVNDIIIGLVKNETKSNVSY